MLDVWMEVAKISLVGFGAGIATGLFLAWTSASDAYKEDFKKEWEPVLLEFLERVSD